MAFPLTSSAWPTHRAVQLSILYLKTTLHVAIPIEYRGGTLFELYKVKGHHWDMTKYRSILLADSIGKVSARARRRASAHHLAQELRSDLSMQCGGVPGLGTEFPVIAVSMLQERAKARGESIGLLYVDAIQAFYAVLRSLVVAVTESDEAVAFLFAQLKLPASALDELRTILAQGPCLNQSDINQATKRDIASTFSACHFTVRGSSLIGGGNKGARPGHHYADVVISYAFHNISESIAEDLDRHGLRPPCTHSQV